MNRVWVLFVFLVVAFVPVSGTFADGKVFAAEATAEVDIPDQEALIHWADGVETLVIRTSFTGEGDEFAWVVPTPSEPEVTASTTGLFPTLRTLTAPKIQAEGLYWSLGVWFLVLIICTWRLQHSYAPVLILALIIVVILILLPALGASRSSVGTGLAIEVHNSKVVGDFEIVVLSADNPQALDDWLKDNGFAVNAASTAAIKAYIEEGWFFTAVRLKPSAIDNDKASVHPLAFRFPTDQPVYPMRLTAIGSTGLAVDLYVFGPQKAAADNFDVTYCNRTVIPPAPKVVAWSKGWSEPGLPVIHPELAERVDPSVFATKLTAKLTPADMQKDVRIRWDGAQILVPRPWTPKASRVFATNIGMTGAALSFLILAFRISPERRGRIDVNIRGAVLLLAVTVFWIIVAWAFYLLMPTTDASINRNRPMLWLMQHRYLATVAASASIEYKSTSPPVSDDWMNEYRLEDLNNPITRESIQVCDEPGNFTYEWTDSGLVITAYGPDGTPLQIDSDIEDDF